MNYLLFDPGPIALDPSVYVAADTFSLAMVVADETEAQRVAEGGTRGGAHRLSDLLRFSSVQLIANGRHWFEFLTVPSLALRCAGRLGISLDEFLTRCINELRPANWETLWWMSQYFGANKSEVEQLAIEATQQMDQIEKRLRKEISKKATDRLHAVTRDVRAEAIAWYQSQRMSRASLSKDEAASEMAGKVFPFKFRTIRDWLKNQ